MGKLAVVFFAALALQAAFGRVARDYSYGRDNLSGLINTVVSISDDIYETLHNAPVHQDIAWEKTAFKQQVEEIINYLEDLTTKYDGPMHREVLKIVEDLREICSCVKQMWKCTDKTMMRQLQTEMASWFKKVSKGMKSWIAIFEDKHFDGDFYAHIETVLRKFMFAFEKFGHFVSTYESRDFEDRFTDNHYSFNDHGSKWTPDRSGKDVHELINELEIMFRRVDFDDDLMRRTLWHLIQEYIEELHQLVPNKLHSSSTKSSAYSVEDMKTHFYSFVKHFTSNMDSMPKTAYVGFVKATHKFHSRIHIMLEIDTPMRRLVYQIHTFTDSITSGYKIIPFESDIVKHFVDKVMTRYIKDIEHVLSEMESNGDHEKIVRSIRKITSEEDDWTVQSLMMTLEEVTTEFHKWMMMQTDKSVAVKVGTKFVKILEKQKEMVMELYEKVKDIDVWTMHTMAMTNAMSVYFNGVVYPEDMHMLMMTIKKMIAILQNESEKEYKELYRLMKKMLDEFETEPYLINTFLQNIVIELNGHAWDFYERTETFPNTFADLLMLYLTTLQTIYDNNKIVSGLSMVQTPPEITIKIQDVADRLTKMMNIIVPGFIHLTYHGYYFHQMLELAQVRLQQVSHNHPQADLMKHVYENLHEIQKNLIHDVKHHDMFFKEKLGIYIYDAVMEMNKLAFGWHFENDVDLVKMYADFFFGIRHLLNEVQCGFQFTTSELTPETVSKQISSASDHISTLLHRIQMKPELKRVVLTQMDFMAREAEALADWFDKMPGCADLQKKYTKMYKDLAHMVKSGWDVPIEELCAFLNGHIETVSLDLERLTFLNTESPAYYDSFKYVMITLSNIMVRLDNVHFYEYYHEKVDTRDLVKFMGKLSSQISRKLRSEFVSTDEIKYDLAVQTLRYAYHLERVIGRFQVEAKVFPKGLYDVMSGLVHLIKSQTVSVNDVKSKLSSYVMTIMSEIEKLIAEESFVGLESGLIKYMVLLEELYVDIEQMVLRTHNWDVHHLKTHVYAHVHYLSMAIDHIDPENKMALSMLRTEFRRLFNFFGMFSSKLEMFGQHSDTFRHVYRKLSKIDLSEIENVDDVDELKMTLSLYAHSMVFMIRQLMYVPETSKYQGKFTTDLANESVDHKTIVFFFEHLLVIIQRMNIEIRTHITLPQLWYKLNKWGFLHGNTFGHIDADHKFGNAYDFTSTKFGKQSEYEPKHGSHEFFQGMFGGESDFDRKYGNPKYTFEFPKMYEYSDSKTKHHDDTEYFFQNPHTRENYKTMEFEYPARFSEYTYGSEHDTMDFKTLLKSVKNIVGELSEILGSNKYEVKHDTSMYVRQLVHILDNIMDRLESEDTSEYDIKHIIKTFKQIKKDLQSVATTDHHGDSKYQWSNAIEEIATEMEKLARVLKHGSLLRDVYLQFFDYVDNLKHEILDVYGGKFGGYKTEKPWSYTQNVFGIPSSHFKYL